MSPSESLRPRRRHRVKQVRRPAFGVALLVSTCTVAAALGVMIRLSSTDAALQGASAARRELNADSALRESPTDLTTAERENEAALSAAPLTATAWARKAYIRQAKTGGLDRDALADLESSYRAAPLGPDITRWRVKYMFENWGRLSPALRARATTELEVYARFHRGSNNLARTIRDPAGRLSATLTTQRAYRERGASRPAAPKVWTGASVAFMPQTPG